MPTVLSGQANKIQKTLALIGHPNVGKSVIFNNLTGKYVTVSNFPGTTVDISRGSGRIDELYWQVYDTPGVMSLHSKTDDERVTRDFLIETRPDIVVQIADAKYLQKALHLTLEIAEFGLPQILVLNMADEAQDRGIDIDVARLSEILGIPVVSTIAITGEGIDLLKKKLTQAVPCRVHPQYSPEIETQIKNVEACLLASQPFGRALATSLLGRDADAMSKAVRWVRSGMLGLLEKAIALAEKWARPSEVIFFEARQVVIQEILAEVLSIHRPGAKSPLAVLGNALMRPLFGYGVAFLTLFAMYQFVGVFGAGFLVGFLEETVFGSLLNPFLIKLVDVMIPVPFIQDALVGPYGIITMALTYALALILPIVTCFFLFFGFLEDSGYLPRLAVMMDRFFRFMGLNGRAVLPMVLGLGCGTMATVTTRILDSRREKLITSLLLTLAVPCSAQLGAILGMAAGFSIKVLFIWLFVVLGTMMAIGWAVGKILPGSRSPFLIEIPPLRWPTWINIVKKIKSRLKWYLREVIPLFMLATFVLFLLDKVKLIGWLEKVFSPVVVNLLGLPLESAQAFLIGFFRRDYGAAGFFMLAQNGQLTAPQVAVSMVVITLFMPCVAHFLITLKERGLKATILISLFVMGYALMVGAAVNLVLKNFPIL